MVDFIKLSNTQFETTIDQRIFSQEVVFKSTNWLLNEYNIYFNHIDDHYLKVLIEEKGNGSIMSFDNLKSKLNSYLNDYKTREIIFNQTKNIRDILLIKAFSNFGELSEKVLLSK